MTLAVRLVLMAACLALGTGIASSSSAQSIRLDRAIVRFIAPETGGVTSPRFVFERELAFEARLEALSDRDHSYAIDNPYKERHIRSALERHVAETVLESLEIDPSPGKGELDARIEGARVALIQRVGGLAALNEAARAEGIDSSEVLRLLRRQARASLYLDRMVTPMLEPSDAELRSIHRTLRTPFSGRAFEEIAKPLRRWYVGRRLSEAVLTFYEGARSRVTLSLLQ